MAENTTTFANEINRAQHQAMLDDDTMLSFGLGIDDPTGIFGTTKGLAESFGAERVFDMPTAENGMTGVGIGAAIAGSRVLMTHQRVDFFLLAMDQLVNNAAKWHYMFNGQMKVPLTIRLIIGRGWGQGPTHAQNLQSWFAHIPGLKVIVPSQTQHVGQQLYQAIMDDNPVLFLEHRWLHQQQCLDNLIDDYSKATSATKVHRQGTGITIIANSYMLLESLHAASALCEQGIDCEVVEISQVNPVDWQPVYQSVKKTGHLLVCDAGALSGSFAGEVITRVTETCFSTLKMAPKRIALPDHPEPTSFNLTKHFYNDANDIIAAVATMFGIEPLTLSQRDASFHDIPGQWFKGPF